MDDVVTLSWPEVAQAATVGVWRRIHAYRRARSQPYGNPTHDLWGLDIESACAELAVAKALGRYWAGSFVGDPSSLNGDVGDELQVRSTWRTNGCLLVHPADRDSDIFVLVVGTAPTYRLAGWTLGETAKKPQFWRDAERPCFFVPQSSLAPIGLL